MEYILVSPGEMSYGWRRDGVASFPFEFNEAGVLHVYPFWGREDETAFSQNVYFALAGESPAAESQAGKVTTGESR